MIVQIEPFDITTASPHQILGSAGFWANLPRITKVNSARLLMVTDTLQPEDVVEGFHAVAVPADVLPPGVRAYRMQYEMFLHQTVQAVRYMRLYLVLDAPALGEEGLLRLLGSYGIRARRLDGPVPRPFAAGTDAWGQVEADDGSRWVLLRSKVQQAGAIFPRSLHRLFGLDFPVWAALHIYTFPQREAVRVLRQKTIAARYAPRSTSEAAQEASEVERGASEIRREMSTTGASLHTVRFYVLVGADGPEQLASRVEIVRGSVPFEMETVHPAGEVARRVFSVEPITDSEGTPATTSGVTLLVGSAMSYRRRTETRGILLGIDRNQAPVVFNIFDDRAPSYNMVVLGQTGAGKTFAVLLMMLRHLLLGCRLIIVDPQGNIDLSFLGPEVYHRAVLGTREASVNILDIVHDEIGNQVDSAVSMLAMLGVLRQDDLLARAVLDEVLMDIYEPIWGRVSGTEAPTLEAVQARLERMASRAFLPGVRDKAALLAFQIAPYIQGSRAELFGRPTTVDFSLRHPVTVYDVSRLPQQEAGGNLRAALLAILVADINQAIRRLRRAGDRAPTLFFVDEMGILMRDAVIASHVSAEYKTARARLVGMIVADQDLHSLLGPRDERGLHHGIPILANAATVLIFTQRDSEKPRVREFFPGLPDSLVDALPALPRGTCIAQFPDDLLVVNVIPSDLDQIVLSSQLRDRERARAVMRRLLEEVYGGYAGGDVRARVADAGRVAAIPR
jgi:hypothetical protein